jgi:hypothetical protein
VRDTAEARERALRFTAFVDGVEEGGLHEYARRGRLLVRDLLDALDALDAERSARVSLQERVERQDAILARHAGEGLR